MISILEQPAQPATPETETAITRQTIMDALDHLLAEDETVLLADGFEDAFLGVARQFGRPFALYDRQACIDVLINRDAMDEEEAEEYFSFNVEGSIPGNKGDGEEESPAYPAFLEWPLEGLHINVLQPTE